ncbi:MAG: hypothetical protein ABR591_08865 [Candidatus Velthaea sp.]
MIIEHMFDVKHEPSDCRQRYRVMLPALPAALAARAPAPPAPAGATIESSGSTNTMGFSIAVRPDGAITVTQPGATRDARVPRVLAERLYDDLARIGALDALPAGACMKSASFGSRLSVEYKGRRTPDLSCVQNDAERTLSADANAIVNAAHIVNRMQYGRPSHTVPMDTPSAPPAAKPA